MMKKILCLLLFAGVSTMGVKALEPDEPAPEISIKKWVKNDPVKIADGKGKNIYVVEFWATWCPPCKTSIPHLSKLQKMYKDKGVIVVGITKEDEEKVAEFVSKQKNMDYHVGIDNDGKTNEAYMKGINSIPTAFVIDKNGIVVWRGHPMELDSVLPKVIDGNFDIEANKKLINLKKQLQLAMQQRNINEVIRLSEAILDIDVEDLTAMQVRLMLFQQQGQSTAAIAFFDQLIKRHPENVSIYFIKLSLLWDDTPGKVKLCAEDIMKKFGKNHETMNRLAWDLLENCKFGTQPLGVVLSAAEKGVTMAPKDNTVALSAGIDTLARCYYAVGRIDKAIEAQSRAVKVASGTEQEKGLQQILDFYKEAKALGESIK